MKPQTLWLLVMGMLALTLLVTAILIHDHTDAVRNVLAILAIVVGALAAVGPKVFKNGNGKE